MSTRALARAHIHRLSHMHAQTLTSTHTHARSHTRSHAHAPHCQMALIGAVSGLIVALLVFMGFRLVLMRRHLSRLTPEEMAMFNGMGGMGPNGAVPLRPIFPGVPANIVSTFRCFEFDAATFDEETKKKEGGSGDDGGECLDKGAATIGAYHGPRGDGAGEGEKEGGEERAGGITIAHTGDDSLIGGAGAATAAAAGAAAAGAANGNSGDDDDAPQCSVCICDYEEGELLMQLPCMHVFHQPCITTWMRAHNTCPNCRQSLVPPPTTEEIGEMRAEAERRQRAVDGVLWGWGRGSRVAPSASVGGGAPPGPPPAGMHHDPAMPPPPGYPPPQAGAVGGPIFTADGHYIGDGNGPHHLRHPGPGGEDVFEPGPGAPPAPAQGYYGGGAGYGAGGRPEVEMVEGGGSSPPGAGAQWRAVRAPVELEHSPNSVGSSTGQVPGQVIDSPSASRAGSLSRPLRASSIQPPNASQL
jgi:hypothetical protein